MEGVRYTCVGSGTCVPSAARGPACHLLQAGGLRLLLDLGSGSLRSLARLGEGVSELSAVGVTHRHIDHVADLLPLLFALRYGPGLQPAGPLTVFGYPGLRKDLEKQQDAFGSWVLAPGFELVIRELPPGESLRLQAGESSALITAHAVRHSPEAVGFRIELSGALRGFGHRPDAALGRWVRTFAYSGDSGPTESLVELARGTDLFVCECAFPDGDGVEGHLTPSELLPLCAAAAPRRTVATHFYPVWDERGVEREWAKALRRFGGGLEVISAHDGLRLELAQAR